MAAKKKSFDRMEMVIVHISDVTDEKLLQLGENTLHNSVHLNDAILSETIKRNLKRRANE